MRFHFIKYYFSILLVVVSCAMMMGQVTVPLVVDHGGDSSRVDVVQRLTHLYSNAYVRYEDYEITADYIVLDLATNEIKAAKNKKGSKIVFSSGGETVRAEELRFNLNTQSGIVYGANIVQNDLYIHGAVTKFRRGANDSLEIEDVIYNRNALVTTCDHEHPHWGIRTSKLKMIPDRLAVLGPSYMEIAGLPTPLVLPFAFAPFVDLQNASSGILAPQEFLDVSSRSGVGIRGIGYYWALSDYADLDLRANLYTRGTWALSAKSNYKKRYKYTGSLDLSYSHQVTDVADQIDPSIARSYRININHQQDAKAHPYRKIGGSLRFSVNDYDRRNFNDAASQLNSQINSNFGYSYRISDKWNFTSAITHSQNTLDRKINFTLPDITVRSSNIYPFKKKESINDEAWYEKINVTYTGRFQNTVSTLDTLLFRQETLGDFRSGFTHKGTANASYKMLDYVSFNTNVSYDELWYLQTLEAQVQDTVLAGVVQPGFKAYRDVRVAPNFSTNLFATTLFKKGWLRGLRHSMQPSVGFSYSPSSERYYEEIEYQGETIRYNPFANRNAGLLTDEQLFQSQPLQEGSASITYAISNTVEGKYWSKKDSTEKKFNIIENLNINGNYNYQKDSLRWSNVRFNGNVSLFKRMSRLTFSGDFSPYVLAQNDRPANRSVWSDRRSPLRLHSMSLSISTTFRLEDVRSLLLGESDEQRQERARQNRGSRQLYPELFSWFENARIQHIYSLRYNDKYAGGEWTTSTHSIQMTTGQIPLTEKWGMSVGNLSYDLKNKRWVYPSFTLSRDLHCWQMQISWQPSAQTYSFFIGVKAAPFSEYLKYRTGSDVFDVGFR